MSLVSTPPQDAAPEPLPHPRSLLPSRVSFPWAGALVSSPVPISITKLYKLPHTQFTDQQNCSFLYTLMKPIWFSLITTSSNFGGGGVKYSLRSIDYSLESLVFDSFQGTDEKGSQLLILANTAELLTRVQCAWTYKFKFSGNYTFTFSEHSSFCGFTARCQQLAIKQPFILSTLITRRIH